MSIKLSRRCASASLVVLALLASSVAAQNLPGPATGGWYVLMGRHQVGSCHAQVQPAARKDARDIGGGSGEMQMIAPLVTKRFGPYPTATAARDALLVAGWRCHQYPATGHVECSSLEGC